MSIEIGAKVKGKVTGITNFGAFVDLGDHQTGLVHISEISDSYVKDIHDVLAVGDEVTVKVLSMKDGKIGLSIRKAQDKPNPVAATNNTNTHTHSHPQHRSQGHRSSSSNQFSSKNSNNNGKDFDSLLSGFLKESEDRLTSLKRNTEGKRGGRGGRRS
ncbi:S1 domain-containing RNA-binding protein [Agrilactobacillus fermenti]|uniref:S1 domain-containing RNA-binding protein n=1 Tax=Agrilactobacillus fermenti TaxID=2586909 RepID=UPI001E56CEAF|nr:S1 domain-containing RNA-binding protein [Agrilactobacillus fermenti]MCD2255942.1 RNA-binding protein S1 [Agrilactobacillus fermenti]